MEYKRSDREKIVWVINNFAIGGSERIVLDIISQLKEQHEVHIVSVLGGGPLGEEFKKHAGHVYFAGPRYDSHKGVPKKLLWILTAPITFVKLLRYIAREKPHAVLSSLFLADVLGMTAAQLVGVKRRILVQHDVHEFGRFKNFLKVHVGLANATRIIAVSDAVKNFLQITWRQGAEKVVVITNSVDVESLQQGIREGERGDVVIGYLGRLEKIKGPQYFVEALRILAQKEVSPKTFIFGSGDLESSLQETAQRHGLTHVHFEGTVLDVPSALQKVDLLVVPSEEEGFGLVVTEALFAGKVVIASDLPAFHELINAGENGLLFQAKDSESLAFTLEKVLGDKELLQALQEGVAWWAETNKEKFDIATKAREYKKALDL